MFKNYGFDQHIERQGVSKTVNGLIHCVMQAVGSTSIKNFLSSGGQKRGHHIALTYVENDSVSQRETYVAEWRRGIADDPNYINCLKQELYDYTEEEISLSLREVYEPFDSYLYIRLLELYFGITIYVFILKRDAYSYPYLEIPRNRHVYIRNRDRVPALVLFKNYKNEEHLTYDIVVFRSRAGASGGDVILLNPDYSGRMFSMYQDMYSVSFFSKHTPKTKILPRYDNLFTFNLYSFLLSMNLTPIAQYLDHYGKCRGYLVQLNEGGRVPMGSILSFPQQPRNLPVAAEVIPLSYTAATRLFGGADGHDTAGISRITVDQDEIRGIWFSVSGYELGVYVPVVIDKEVPEKAISHLLSPSGPLRAANPLVPTGITGAKEMPKGDSFSAFVNTKDRLKKYLKIITWLYRLRGIPIAAKYLTPLPKQEKKVTKRSAYIERNRLIREELLAFQNLFIIVEGPSSDYQLDDVEIDSPDVTTFAEALSYVEEFSQGTIVRREKGKKSRIVMDSKKLRDDMIYYLETFLSNQPLDFYKLHSPPAVTKLNERLFASFEDFESWVSTFIRPLSIILDAEEINAIRAEPLVYRAGLAPESPMYIIQNVRDGDLARALSVAIGWQKNGSRNYGYDSPVFQFTEVIKYHVLQLMGRELAEVELVSPPQGLTSPYEDLYVLRLTSLRGARNAEAYAAVLRIY